MILNETYTLTNGIEIPKLATEMKTYRDAATAIRAEEGNIRYGYFFPMEEPETVLLIDAWKDQAAIDAHHASPMMEKISELREKYDLHMEVERYVSDVDGLPSKDMKYIRN